MFRQDNTHTTAPAGWWNFKRGRTTTFQGTRRKRKKKTLCFKIPIPTIMSKCVCTACLPLQNSASWSNAETHEFKMMRRGEEGVRRVEMNELSNMFIVCVVVACVWYGDDTGDAQKWAFHGDSFWHRLISEIWLDYVSFVVCAWVPKCLTLLTGRAVRSGVDTKWNCHISPELFMGHWEYRRSWN